MDYSHLLIHGIGINNYSWADSLAMKGKKRKKPKMVEPLYLAKVKCLHCENTFQTSRVRSSFKKAKKTDTDFCIYFDEHANPEYYVVRVCPFCGFAFTENFSERILPAQKQAYMERLGRHWAMQDYCGKRNWEDALRCYKLALLCAQIKEESKRIVAGILHHIAWLYRYRGEAEQEKRFLQYALEAYIHVYEREGTDVNNARLMYLIGELHRRLGDFHEAVRWFARVINNKSITDATMIHASREQWMAVREEMRAAKLVVPEDGELHA